MTKSKSNFIKQCFQSNKFLFLSEMCDVLSDMHSSVLVLNRGTKSGEATPQSAHESFDVWPGN